MHKVVDPAVVLGLTCEDTGPLDYTLLHSLDPSQTVMLVRGEVGKVLLPCAYDHSRKPLEVQFSRNDSDRHHLWRSPEWGYPIHEGSAAEQWLENDDKTILMCEFRISVLEENPRLPGEVWRLYCPRPVHQVLVFIVAPTFYEELKNFKFPREVEAAIAREAVHA